MKTVIKSLTIPLLGIMFLVCGCNGSSTMKQPVAATDTAGVILINQIGFFPEAYKIALIRKDVDKFEIIETKSNKTVYTGSAGPAAFWTYSGDSVRIADFSQVVAPGKYRLSINGGKLSSPEFTIGRDVYDNLARAAVKAFYFNRSGFEITPQYGGIWARKLGHPDTAVLIHSSAASKNRPDGTIVSSPGGWYDAGDYNKYIVNSGITTYTLLLFTYLYPEYCDSLNLDIPESNNNIPDVTDELLYNLRWMLTMQDPADGGVYHKLTNKAFDSFEMPDKGTLPRYLLQKTTAATLDFSAVMAMASRVFATSSNGQLRNLSKSCLSAAVSAMKWAKANPDVIYRQPSDIFTGEYGDKNLGDERFWAESELALATNDTTILKMEDLKKVHAGTPTWNQVSTLGIISLATSGNNLFKSKENVAAELLTSYADTLLKKYESSSYRVSLDYFNWGSNSDVANQGMIKLIAYKLTGNRKYLPSIEGDLDYILGRNATSYCFVTGFGYRSPMHIHHRPSGADGVPEPVPGFLAGGPNLATMADCGETVKRSPFPASSYTDSECSYSTNEIAINWNAPLFFLVGGWNAIEKNEK
jgi:endoglucanase